MGFAAVSGIVIACGSSESGTELPTPAQEAGADATPDAADEAAIVGTGTLGAACTDDSQCGAGGTKCLKASGNDFFGDSGPGGGYCSLDCSDYVDHKTDVDPCAAIGGHCFGIKGNGAVCYEPCKRGSTDSKCHGRNDVACTAGRDRDNKAAAWDVCQPACGAATDCGAGRACDPSKGRCVDTADVKGGVADGTACVSPGPDTCSGECIKHEVPAEAGTALAYVCGKGCVTGQTPDVCGTLEACLYLYPGSTKGDLGICLQLCDTVADCKDTVHDVECDPATIATYGHGNCRLLGPTKLDGGI